ncbi:MAG: hypothetical protein V1856_02095 [Candidatus Liptonbacteria bacterium]
MPERIEISEFSKAERELIQKLAMLGPDDPETRDSLLAWTQAGEARANEINTSRANIEFNIARAKLYRVAGFLEAAWDVLESVRTQAYDEGEQDLYGLAMRIMDEIDERGT